MAGFDKMAEMDLHRFLTMPAPRGVTIQCCVQRRRKQNVVQLYLRDETRHLEMGRFLCSAMQKKGKTYVLGATKADVPAQDSPSYRASSSQTLPGRNSRFTTTGRTRRRWTRGTRTSLVRRARARSSRRSPSRSPPTSASPTRGKVSVPAVGEGGVRRLRSTCEAGVDAPEGEAGGKLSLDFETASPRSR